MEHLPSMLEVQTQPLALEPLAWEPAPRPPAARSAPAPRSNERRKSAAADPAALRTGLTPGQLTTLATVEQFHWFLHFVRRPLFQAPIPVLFSRDASRFVVIEEDGSINETPALKLRG